MEIRTVRPSEVRFTQNSVSAAFKNGTPLVSTLMSLLTGQLNVCELQKITCCVYGDNLWVVHGNRRLFLLQKLEDRGLVEYIKVKVKPLKWQLFNLRYTSYNRGLSVTCNVEDQINDLIYGHMYDLHNVIRLERCEQNISEEPPSCLIDSSFISENSLGSNILSNDSQNCGAYNAVSSDENSGCFVDTAAFVDYNQQASINTTTDSDWQGVDERFDQELSFDFGQAFDNLQCSDHVSSFVSFASSENSSIYLDESIHYKDSENAITESMNNVDRREVFYNKRENLEETTSLLVDPLDTENLRHVSTGYSGNLVVTSFSDPSRVMLPSVSNCSIEIDRNMPSEVLYGNGSVIQGFQEIQAQSSPNLTEERMVVLKSSDYSSGKNPQHKQIKIDLNNNTKDDTTYFVLI